MYVCDYNIKLTFLQLWVTPQTFSSLVTVGGCVLSQLVLCVTDQSRNLVNITEHCDWFINPYPTDSPFWNPGNPTHPQKVVTIAKRSRALGWVS